MLWAPRARTVEIVLPATDARLPLRLVGAHEPGYWRADAELAHGTDYLFSVDGGTPVPDPCSTWMPHGVHGASRVLDQEFGWTDGAWRGADLDSGALLRVDLPTFTSAGTLDAAADRLEDVAATGVVGVELSPVATHDPAHGPAAGVRLFAVHEPLGGPPALQRFVDHAHRCGLAVVLDAPHRWAVADDLGLHAFGPYATGSRIGPRTGARPGPPGSDSPRINLDGGGSRGPRDFLVADAERWLRDFHVDGLLLDVDALVDRSAVPFLGELAEDVHGLGEQLGRRLHLLVDGPGRSDRLTTVVHHILASPGDADPVQDLRRLAHEVFPPTTSPWRPPSLRRAHRATQRAASVLVSDLTRLPAANRSVPWTPDAGAAGGAVATVTDDDRACLLTFAILAGTPPVLDTEHVPVPVRDERARRLVDWTRALLALRPAASADRDLPVEVRTEGTTLLGRRGRTAVALVTGTEPADVDVSSLPSDSRVVAAWDPAGTTLRDGVLRIPPRSPAVLHHGPSER
ncbi:maltooligosyltrehalose trehalohydrolase [Krasilnikoviella flava]|uniref:Maltooligosyltrehalose trehalohydrolase n=1 Tax=Krasilnikoviella flava TaxID=526729 RepID=A0A1T5L8R6_9MICO|nr:maltooligosyltrehalose trehalohydrolase [Krasilnikoviella flava]